METSSISSSSTISGSKLGDLKFVILFAFTFPVIREVLKRLIYQPLGQWVMFSGKGNQQLKPQTKEGKLRKWNESCWKATVYTFFTVLAFLISYNEPWFYDSRYFWIGCSAVPCPDVVPLKILLFYSVETGFYVQAIHYLLMEEVHRKDYFATMAHHIVTLILLMYSYYTNFTKVGVMVMLLHDISDPFLEAAKLCRYAKRQTYAIVGFIVFTVVWVLSRCIYFPFQIIRSSLYETLEYIVRDHGVSPHPHWELFNGMFISLLALHLYWTYLIVLTLVTQYRTGDGYDVREKEE